MQTMIQRLHATCTDGYTRRLGPDSRHTIAVQNSVGQADALTSPQLGGPCMSWPPSTFAVETRVQRPINTIRRAVPNGHCIAVSMPRQRTRWNGLTEPLPHAAAHDRFPVLPRTAQPPNVALGIDVTPFGVPLLPHPPLRADHMSASVESRQIEMPGMYRSGTYPKSYQANIRASTVLSRSFIYCAFSESTVD